MSRVYLCKFNGMGSIQKNLSVETLRGITIILVVMGHVIGSAPNGGIKIDFPHLLRYVYLWIDYIQMPLFTAIAGWVYALKPFSDLGGIDGFVRKKALRLLVPMAVVGTLYFLVQYVMPGTNNKGDLTQIWRIYIFPYTIYWYLPSLFLIFMVQWYIDSRQWMNNWVKWGVCCGVAVALSMVNDKGFLHELPNLFSFKGAIGQLPYFFVGVAACRFAEEISYRNLVKWLMGAIALTGIVMIQIVWFEPEDSIWIRHNLYVLALIPTLFLLLAIKWHNHFFVWVGRYAYTIYLFHGFGTSGGRIILQRLNIYNEFMAFIFATIIAVFLPILVEKLFSKVRLFRVFFLGKK